jgi:hypothetical protein
MKLLVNSFFIYFSTNLLSVHAQNLNLKVKWGEEFKTPRSTLNDVVGYDATGFYAVHERSRTFGKTDYSLQHFDPNMNPGKVVDLEIKSGKRSGAITNILHLKGRLLLFYTVEDTKTKKNSLYLDEIDKGTLLPTHREKKIGEIDFTGKGKRNRGSFQYRVSRDSSKILVLYALPYDEDTPEKFGFTVLDNQLNLLWTKEITMPYRDDLYDGESFRVDNSGNAYVLGLVYKEKRKEKRKGQPNYSYEILACRDNGTTLKQYPVSLEDRFLTDMQIEILDNQTILCVGFYSEKGTVSIRGTYFLRVDAASAAIVHKSFKEFGIDFITQNMSGREQRKAKRQEEPELYEFDLDKLLIGKDGSAILVGEQYYVQTVTSTMRMAGGGMMTQITYHYYYNDIIVVKFSAEGNVLWTQKIPKTQHTANDGGFYSSYCLVISKGKICFVFNDNPKNLEADENEKAKNYNPRKSVVVLVSVDQAGNITKQPVFSALDAEVIVRPKVCKQISNGEVLLYGQRKKTQQFANMSIL